MTFPQTLVPLLAATMGFGGCVYNEYEEPPRRVYRSGYVERNVVVARRPAHYYDGRRQTYYDDRPRQYYGNRPRVYSGGSVTLQTTRSSDSRARVYHDQSNQNYERRRYDDRDRD